MPNLSQVGYLSFNYKHSRLWLDKMLRQFFIFSLSATISAGSLLDIIADYRKEKQTCTILVGDGITNREIEELSNRDDINSPIISYGAKTEGEFGISVARHSLTKCPGMLVISRISKDSEEIKHLENVARMFNTRLMVIIFMPARFNITIVNEQNLVVVEESMLDVNGTLMVKTACFGTEPLTVNTLYQKGKYCVFLNILSSM